MRKDWKTVTVHINRHHLFNWAIGIDYYHEALFVPVEAYGKVCQINLLFFNITITKWGSPEWI